jgi:hypothetical protein
MELSLEEIEALYPGEYILVDVTELEGGEPVRGLVIAHGPEREPLENRLNQEWEHMSCPYLFFNGPLVPEDTIVVL